MSWEQRGGKKYYYRAGRIDGRVVKEYIGAGPVAERSARADELQRQARAAHEAERDEILELERDIARVRTAIRAAVRRELEAYGFYQHHRGEWRRKRGT